MGISSLLPLPHALPTVIDHVSQTVSLKEPFSPYVTLSSILSQLSNCYSTACECVCGGHADTHKHTHIYTNTHTLLILLFYQPGQSPSKMMIKLSCNNQAQHFCNGGALRTCNDFPLQTSPAQQCSGSTTMPGSAYREINRAGSQ